MEAKEQARIESQKEADYKKALKAKKEEVGKIVEPTERYVIANKGTSNLNSHEKSFFVQKFDMYKIEKSMREIIAEDLSPIMKL